jgi:hypothetical protein
MDHSATVFAGKVLVRRKPVRVPAALLLLTLLASCASLSAPAAPPTDTLSTSIAGGLTSTRVPPTATGAGVATLSPMPARVSPTPVDPSSLSSVDRMGRLSLDQGWGVAAGRLLRTDDEGVSWCDITPSGPSNCPEPDVCTIASSSVFLDATHARIAVVRGQEFSPPVELSFMYTENGGRTWGLTSIAQLGHSLICPGEACLTDVDLESSDPVDGWLAAHAPPGMSSDVKYLYRTQDAGHGPR